jgi:cellobiose-specific phosphotransferase system component IIA
MVSVFSLADDAGSARSELRHMAIRALRDAAFVSTASSLQESRRRASVHLEEARDIITRLLDDLRLSIEDTGAIGRGCGEQG